MSRADWGPRAKGLASSSLAALGVVYGDIGTSPLYAVRECFHGEFAIAASGANILGILSLMFWSLTIIVTVKYLTYILRADNNGEGGVIALTALVMNTLEKTSNSRWIFVGVGLFAASLLYGDGMITPAISVLSAVEGLGVITPVFQPYVAPTTVLILVGLFLFQRRGTGGVGALFGPVMIVWFVAIGALGVAGIARHPSILLAVNPWHGASFLLRNHGHGFLVLGAVFLVVTGAETLYADLGHFGPRPIRAAWFFVVLPALLCNYFGQGALLMNEPAEAVNPFYALAPQSLLAPLVVLATMATVIASQAVISGAFSLTRQASQLGYLPRLRIIHTSARQIGQIYIPPINWMLMIATILLVLIFGTSSKLAAAYGVAVTTTMLVATSLFYVVARYRWGWSRAKAGVPVAAFLVVDASFFASNIGKITHGAWFPLAIGAAIFALLTTWNKGRALVWGKLYSQNPPLAEFIRRIAADGPTRVPGKAVYMAGSTFATPPALLQNFKHNRVIHADVAIVTVITELQPTVPRARRVEVRSLDQGFHQVVGRYGFMEEADIREVLALAREQGLSFDLNEVSFFLGRENIKPARPPLLSPWRRRVFSFLARNAMGATTYYQIPPEQVMEVGMQVEI